MGFKKFLFGMKWILFIDKFGILNLECLNNFYVFLDIKYVENKISFGVLCLDRFFCVVF